MNRAAFFETFDLFADAPDAVAKMRELVLQLAVQGQLVERKESDGNAASIFPKGLGAELASRYEVAENWIWIRFAVVGEQRLGKMLDQKGNRGELKPYLRNTNVQWMRFQLDDVKELRLESDELEEYRLLPGDLLICEGGEPGRCAIWRDPDREMYFQKAIHRVRPRKGILSEYLAICLQVDAQNGVLAKHFTGATIKHFTGRSLSDYSIPLPPLAEQKRIVAKVDELMALCDRLEAQQQERETRHAALARASLARFTDAPTPANLPFLFHPSYPIPPADLRKSILTLAVQGKLVPQDPTDRDARAMIDRAMEKRQQTIKTKSLRRKELDESADLFEHADLPSSWCVERFANLVDPENTISYGVLVPGNDVPDGIPFVRAQDLCLSNHPPRPNKTIAPEIEKPYARTRLTGGEILLCVVGSIGKLGVVPHSWAGANIARAVARIKPISDVLRDYLLLVLQEQSVQNYFTSTTRTLAQPTLNVGMIEQTPIPVPPLAEQHRIVAKVEQLMTLVDELETQLAASRATAANLLSALVAELTTASSRGIVEVRRHSDDNFTTTYEDEFPLLKVAESTSDYR
jgi:type I restriction enzyme, S subunit